ncbi:MAG: hypothetical protein HZC40_12030 [Chloroflexi bacterium]|nr:hypothetical protein [Chloroflexota bacterium]
MQVSGLIMKSRSSAYPNKKTGELIHMVYFDLYDDTAGLIQCEIKANGAEPPDGSKVVGDVQFLRKIAFGQGVSVALKSFRVLDVKSDAPGWVPPLPPGVGPKK